MKKDLWILTHATAEVKARDFFGMNPQEWHGCAERMDSDPETMRIFESATEAKDALKQERCGCIRRFSDHGIHYVGWEDYYVEHVMVEYDPEEEGWEDAYECGEVDYPGESFLAPCLVTLEGEDEDGGTAFPEAVIAGSCGSVADAVTNALRKIDALPKATADGAEIAYTVKVGGIALKK